MVLTVRHTGIVVRDLKRATDFYTDILGFAPFSQDRETGPFISRLVGIPEVDVAWVKLKSADGCVLEILEYHSHPDTSSHEAAASNKVANLHLALTVENLEELYLKLKDLGLPCHGSPQIAPHGKVKVLYAHDPDGVILELVEELERSD